MQTAKINQGNIALKRVVESIANGDYHTRMVKISLFSPYLHETLPNLWIFVSVKYTCLFEWNIMNFFFFWWGNLPLLCHRLFKSSWSRGTNSCLSDLNFYVSYLIAVGMDHVRVHPKFLHSNATSHKWALGG